MVVMQELDLHRRHVDAGRAFALAALAGDAQRQRVVELARRERARPELARQREAQRVRSTARHVPLVARHAVRRAHRARIELAAMAVVVAHLHRGGEAAAAVLGADFVLGPVEPRGERRRAVVGLETEQRLRSSIFVAATILPGFIEPLRIERALDLGERSSQARAVDRLDPLGAHEPVAVLAGIRAFVFLDQRAGFLGDRAHLPRAAIGAQIQHGPHVQAADRGVGVERAARAVLREHLRQPLRVVGEMLERHGAVLDERHGFPVALHRHHDVEARFADLPDVALPRRVRDLDDAARQPEVAHELAQTRELRKLRRLLVAGELDEQDRIGLAADRLVHRRRGTRRCRARARSSCGRRARRPWARERRCAASGPSPGRTSGSARRRAPCAAGSGASLSLILRK